jgi:hypothetical protein
LRGGRLTTLVLAFLIAGLAGTTLSAHRHDEYLQAARLAVEPRRVDVQIDLTPGIAIAEMIIRDVDGDGDGTLSRDEQRAYVARVLDALELRIDGRPLQLQPATSAFPDLDAVRGGVGTIQLRMAATVPHLSEGEHELAFHNRHRPDVSVYLANALVPDGDSIAITAQRRDVAQRDLTIAYVVRNQADPTTAVWLLGALSATLLTGLFAPRVRRRASALSPSRKNRWRVRGGQHDGFEVLAEVQFSTGRAELFEKRMHLAEGGEHLPMRGTKRVAVNGACRHERGGHVPIAKNHANRRIALAAHQRDEFVKGLRVEIGDEPGARFAQDRLTPQVEQSKIEEPAFKRRRHAAHSSIAVKSRTREAPPSPAWAQHAKLLCSHWHAGSGMSRPLEATSRNGLP